MESRRLYPMDSRAAPPAASATGRRKAARAALTVVLAVWLATLASGCFGMSSKQDAAVPAPPPAPVAYQIPPVPHAYRAAFGWPRSPDGERLTPEERLYYQAQLDAVRPPVRGPLTVVPVNRRVAYWENEFSDAPYAGFASPVLPPLPGDRDHAAGNGPGALTALAGPANAGAGAGAAKNAAARPKPKTDDPRVAALFEKDLRPVEQLVYGGEHPEIAPPPAYRLQARDTVRVHVREHQELSGEARIADDGRLLCPGTGDRVALRGKTVDEAAAIVRRTLAPYIRGNAPEVEIEPVGTRGGHYFVFGAVRHPGRFPMGSEPVRLSDAVLAANWEALASTADSRVDELGPAFPAAHPRGRFVPPANADLAAVQLYTPHRSLPSRSVHNLAAAFAGGAHGDDPHIRPGQVVIVPSTDPRQNAAWMNNPTTRTDP